MGGDGLVLEINQLAGQVRCGLLASPQVWREDGASGLGCAEGEGLVDILVETPRRLDHGSGLRGVQERGLSSADEGIVCLDPGLTVGLGSELGRPEP